MSEHLIVESGETYTVESGVTEEYIRADVDGTLDVQGTLKLIDDAEPPTDDEPRGIGSQPIELPLGISLPVSPLNLSTMQMGIAMFIVGLIGFLGAAAGFLRNYAAGIMLGLAIVALLFSGLLGIGLELFWVAVMATVVLLIMGAVVRWIQ